MCRHHAAAYTRVAQRNTNPTERYISAADLYRAAGGYIGHKTDTCSHSHADADGNDPAHKHTNADRNSAGEPDAKPSAPQE